MRVSNVASCWSFLACRAVHACGSRSAAVVAAVSRGTTSLSLASSVAQVSASLRTRPNPQSRCHRSRLILQFLGAVRDRAPDPLEELFGVREVLQSSIAIAERYESRDTPSPTPALRTRSRLMRQPAQSDECCVRLDRWSWSPRDRPSHRRHAAVAVQAGVATILSALDTAARRQHPASHRKDGTGGSCRSTTI
jgi:hypothetical protein